VSSHPSHAARLLGLAVFALVTAGAPLARANSMDPAVDRFWTEPSGFPKFTINGRAGTCQDLAANPGLFGKLKLNAANATQYACQPNQAAFHNLVTEYGFAIAPDAFHPARTTGFGGFAFTLEASYTKINPDAVAGGVAYWQNGTQGPTDPNTGKFSIVNQSPDSLLQVYSLKARKGFPFGFEVTGDLGYVANTTLWVAGADIRWALLEGFRTGALGYLPDISVGGGVRTLSGTSEFDLTTVGIDVQISKPITVADSGILSPYVGYQRLYIFGDSESVSLAPNVNPLNVCGYEGNMANGQAMCRNTNGPTNLAFNEDTTFNDVRNHRDRGIIGINYRYEVLYLAAQFLVDLVAPSSEDPILTGSRQWTLSFEAGVYF
jgi:hypothetical protein